MERVNILLILLIGPAIGLPVFILTFVILISLLYILFHPIINFLTNPSITIFDANQRITKDVKILNIVQEFLKKIPITSKTRILDGFKLINPQGSIVIFNPVKKDITVGRDVGQQPPPDISINSPSISRTHAMISIKTDCAYICDLNSTNGTMVNGNIIQPFKFFPLKSGDTIQFGSVKFIFQEIWR